jgi:hypothetical protein
MTASFDFSCGGVAFRARNLESKLESIAKILSNFDDEQKKLYHLFMGDVIFYSSISKENTMNQLIHISPDVYSPINGEDALSILTNNN